MRWPWTEIRQDQFLDTVKPGINLRDEVGVESEYHPVMVEDAYVFPHREGCQLQNLLVDMMATRKATLQVRKHSETDLSGSKGLPVRALRTFDRSQVGYLCTTGGLKFVAPLRNLQMVGCCERGPRDP